MTQRRSQVLLDELIWLGKKRPKIQIFRFSQLNLFLLLINIDEYILSNSGFLPGDSEWIKKKDIYRSFLSWAQTGPPLDHSFITFLYAVTYPLLRDLEKRHFAFAVRYTIVNPFCRGLVFLCRLQLTEMCCKVTHSAEIMYLNGQDVIELCLQQVSNAQPREWHAPKVLHSTK